MCRFGEDHRSLTDVLQDLQGQLKGQEPKLLPGQTLSRPLHVILQVSLHYSMILIDPYCCCGKSSQYHSIMVRNINAEQLQVMWASQLSMLQR